jgi:hypothetical protein
VSVEPDERIDKMTGIPYDEQAGVIMRDEEERGVVSLEDPRRGFYFGGHVEELLETAIGRHAEMLYVAEGPHGFTEGAKGLTRNRKYAPVETNDAREANKKIKTYDIGYGHKITADEWASGMIHGIPFTDGNKPSGHSTTGSYVSLTEEDVRTIMRTDIQNNLQAALDKGWRKKLAAKNTSWDKLTDAQKIILQDISYNVGAGKAASAWNDIFDNLGDTPEERRKFIKNSRRKDAGYNTEGMDNRAAQAAFAAGYIKNVKEAHAMGLTLARTVDGKAYDKLTEAQKEELAQIDLARKAAERKAEAELKAAEDKRRAAETGPKAAKATQSAATESYGVLASDGAPSLLSPNAERVAAAQAQPEEPKETERIFWADAPRANVHQGGLVNVLHKRSQRG